MTIDDVLEEIEQRDFVSSPEIDGKIYNALLGVDHPKARHFYGSGRNVTDSVELAIELMGAVLPSVRILTLCDDTLAQGATIWIYPNGLSGGGEFKVSGLHYGFATALCIAILKAKKILDGNENKEW